MICLTLSSDPPPPEPPPETERIVENKVSDYVVKYPISAFG